MSFSPAISILSAAGPFQTGSETGATVAGYSEIDKRTADAFYSLSRGQQRLALIVRALVKHPTVLILDEPLQGWTR